MSTIVDLTDLRRRVGAIPDPEVPVLSLDDLGVLRSVDQIDDRIVVTITPTYSGCPAMHFIEQSITAVLTDAGVDGEVRTVLHPAWTTDWMSADGRAKLRDYGIAPPRAVAARDVELGEMAVTISARPVACPRCGSTNTETVSEFGSTACKSLQRCLDCLEPFDHFKEL
jgi:ring-1,2-phenylacetyl-CoA epoxidase subunit PaaD